MEEICQYCGSILFPRTEHYCPNDDVDSGWVNGQGDQELEE